MSQKHDNPLDPIFTYNIPPHRPVAGVHAQPHQHQRADSSDDALRGDVWRDVGDGDAPLLEESAEVSAFIEQHGLREVVKAMRSRALELFRDHCGLSLELGDDMVWLRLETAGDVEAVKAQDEEFLDWFLERYAPEVTTRVQLNVRFVVL